MKIAVLGGRFDPPHIGHFIIASQVLEVRPDIDKVLLVPTNQHSWKNCVASTSHRLNMLKYLTNKKIEISDIEIRRGGKSFTIDTLRALKEELPPAEYFWIIGSDIVSEFFKWKEPEKLIKETTFFVFPRSPYELPNKLPVGFELIDNPGLIFTNISSTEIRNRLKNKKSIKYLVPEKVEKYIKENKLYV